MQSIVLCDGDRFQSDVLHFIFNNWTRTSIRVAKERLTKQISLAKTQYYEHEHVLLSHSTDFHVALVELQTKHNR